MKKKYDGRERRGAEWIRFLYSQTGWAWLERLGWHPEEEDTQPTALTADTSDNEGAMTLLDDRDVDVEFTEEELERLKGMKMSVRSPIGSIWESPEAMRDLKRILKYVLEHEEKLKEQ